eukprot:IDg19373t1
MKVAMQFIKMFDHVRLNNVPLCVSLLTVVQGAALPMPPPPPPPPPDLPPPPYYDGGGSSDASYANMADVSRVYALACCIEAMEVDWPQSEAGCSGSAQKRKMGKGYYL